MRLRAPFRIVTFPRNTKTYFSAYFMDTVLSAQTVLYVKRIDIHSLTLKLNHILFVTQQQHFADNCDSNSWRCENVPNDQTVKATVKAPHSCRYSHSNHDPCQLLSQNSSTWSPPFPELI